MNKTAVIYSTLTGNTKEVAEAIYSMLPNGSQIYSLTEQANIDLSAYQNIFLGFWVDKSSADKTAAEFMATMQNKRVALFATVGASPDMSLPDGDYDNYGEKCLSNAAALLHKNCKLVNCFICQGRISAKITQAFKQFPLGHPHYLTPERIARHEASQEHPNTTELAAAKHFAVETIAMFKDGK